MQVCLPRSVDAIRRALPRGVTLTMHKIELTVDGMNRTANVEPRMLLVHVLRDELGVTAPKVGCESSRCGACTVQIDGRAVKSCTVLGVQADGAEIETAASLADDGTLDSLQSAFRRAHATQCGYCTPGLLATSDDLLSADPDPSRETIREELEGNLCRCTGYQNVVDAVETAAAAYPRSNDGEALSVAPTADENVDVSETGASGGD